MIDQGNPRQDFLGSDRETKRRKWEESEGNASVLIGEVRRERFSSFVGERYIQRKEGDNKNI